MATRFAVYNILNFYGCKNRRRRKSQIFRRRDLTQNPVKMADLQPYAEQCHFSAANPGAPRHRNFSKNSKWRILQPKILEIPPAAKHVAKAHQPVPERRITLQMKVRRTTARALAVKFFSRRGTASLQAHQPAPEWRNFLYMKVCRAVACAFVISSGDRFQYPAPAGAVYISRLRKISALEYQQKCCGSFGILTILF